MDIAELEQESAELLPDRQALGCWKWSPCGHEYWSCSSGGWGWGGSWGGGWCPPPSHCW
jgi:hypothetical protein